jgi:Neutral/alkaline non-lysosomal ceramidase.
MFKKSVWLLFLLLIMTVSYTQTHTMQVGVASVDITPEGPIRISGFAARGKSETDKVLGRLSAKALAFGSDAQRPSVLITLDAIGIQWRITSKVVEALSKRLGMQPAQIVICASHSHGAPENGNLINILQCRGDYPLQFNFSDSLIALDELIHIAAYNETLMSKLEEVALAALKNRKPALVAWGIGQATFSENRRTAGGPVDHSMPVLRITNPDGSLRAVLLNYACHGISLGADVNEIHGDWMGEAQRAIEARHPGAIAMVAIGCSGDAHPKLRDKMEYMQSYGKEIADNVDKLLASTLQPLTTPPVCAMKWVKLPFSKLPDVPELIQLSKNDTTVKGYYARLALERVQRGESLPTHLNYPVQVWNFGNRLLMVNMGGEVVVDYSTRLKKELGAHKVWINAYSNDVSCYIASRRVIQEGGYEADASMYWYNMPAPLSEKVEDIIISTIRTLVPASFKK